MDYIKSPIDAIDFATLSKAFAANHKDESMRDKDLVAFAACNTDNESVAEFLLENTLLLHKDTCGYAKEVCDFAKQCGKLEAVAGGSFSCVHDTGAKAAAFIMDEFDDCYVADMAEALMDACMFRVTNELCVYTMEKSTIDQWHDFMDALSPFALERMKKVLATK
jgi:hypothetical protein